MRTNDFYEDDSVPATAARMGWRAKWLNSTFGLMKEFWEVNAMEIDAEELFHDEQAKEFLARRR